MRNITVNSGVVNTQMLVVNGKYGIVVWVVNGIVVWMVNGQRNLFVKITSLTFFHDHATFRCYLIFIHM